jgi:phosphoadenosine phosphosulfate reductase
MDKNQSLALNERLKNSSAEEVLHTILSEFPGKTAFSSSLGAEDQVITHMLSVLGAREGIFTLDTGRLFQETYELIDSTNKKYGISIRVMFPEKNEVEAMVSKHGINLFYESVENRKLCCNLRKIQPLKRALQGMEIWITGVRREQSITRFNTPMAEWDDQHNICKINPLREWTEDMVWKYIRDKDIPYNTLHDKGFPSIGCAPCTRAVQAGEDIRAGRWWWEQPENKECGLHPGAQK